MSFDFKRARGKTAVFSGVKHRSNHIPKLEDLCIQKLINNVGRIECVGDVPYYILRPLLTKLSVAQLKRIESYNPQFLDDEESDEPWKVHCQRIFEGRVPDKGENWRDLFVRCEKERDHKLEKIAKKIKKHEKKTIPARQTRVVEHISPQKNRGISGRSHTSTSSSTIRTTKRESSSSTSSKVAPLMLKSRQLLKSRFRR